MFKQCVFEPYRNKFKCKYCGLVVPRNTVKSNCKAQNKNPPDIIKKGKNFTKAIIKHIKSGRKHCSEEEKKQRYEICKSNQCGLFRKYGNGGICAHDDCGCLIRSNGKFLDKLSWADSSCPVGKWGPIIVKNPENGV